MKRFLAALPFVLFPVLAIAQTLPVPVTPRACDVTQVTTGGTAVTAFTGPANGFTLENPSSATEPLLYSLIGAAASSVGGSTFDLAAGAAIQFSPQLSGSVNLSVNAASNNHAFACMRY